MADVRPIFATHYDLDVSGPLEEVAAPPYDVIDTEQRAALLERSPYNAVAIDLPKPYGETGPTPTSAPPGRWTPGARRGRSSPTPILRSGR